MKKFNALFFTLITLFAASQACSKAWAQTSAPPMISTPLSQKTPVVIGHTDSVHSAILNEQRVINVTLPEGYDEKAKATYPVIYLLDGAIDEDFIHIAGAVQFSSFSWVQRLPPSILIGIANTDRKRDMTFTPSSGFEWPSWARKHKESYKTAGGSDKFISFIERELQPYIAQHYKTNGDKTVIGQSLAGLLATEILLKRPNLFNTYIIMSPSLWWDNQSLLKKAPDYLQSLPATKLKVYLAVGEEGAEMIGDAKALANVVQKAMEKQGKFYFDYLPKENHGTILHGAVMQAFTQLYEKI